ncbi:hypothetical protein DKP76_07085 [Falsochrobactrum shanghaiense]|uniref:Uncharacterized protein n=2 Tax=Falsochrobactrum shanghaiense TaxID=2201899 RepID=A0A316JC57_9HYPH|nr:hypothetical protein DKP76_07085 [Falsochrobactrum shanghaiense]
MKPGIDIKLSRTEVHDDVMYVIFNIDYGAEDRYVDDAQYVEGGEMTVILLQGEWESKTIKEIEQAGAERLGKLFGAIATAKV